MKSLQFGQYELQSNVDGLETDAKRLKVGQDIVLEELFQMKKTLDVLSGEKTFRPQNCQEIHPFLAKGITGGIFNIYPSLLTAVEVYCDMITDGGGWIVFQRRQNGSVDFYKGWDEYVNGFGDTGGEFWLGLDALSNLTISGEYELRIDMIQSNGSYRYAKYSSFSVGPSSDFYRLSIDGYSGNATDAFQYHNKQMFTTWDCDNDELYYDYYYNDYYTNCAEIDQGAWWYKDCFQCHLNGLYTGTDTTGVIWQWQNSPTENLVMKFTEMKLRKKWKND